MIYYPNLNRYLVFANQASVLNIHYKNHLIKNDTVTRLFLALIYVVIITLISNASTSAVEPAANAL